MFDEIFQYYPEFSKQFLDSNKIDQFSGSAYGLFPLTVLSKVDDFVTF